MTSPDPRTPDTPAPIVPAAPRRSESLEAELAALDAMLPTSEMRTESAPTSPDRAAPRPTEAA